MRNIGKILRDKWYMVLAAVVAVGALAGLISIIEVRIRSDAIGTELGQAIGSQVGRYAGSLEALTDYREAYAEGKEQGLSAEDTTAEVLNQIKKGGKIEVLVASVKLNDIHTVGEDYAALYLLKGDAVFTVDLTEVKITEQENGLCINVPKPEMELIVDQNSIEKVTDYQKKFFNGSSEDGFDAYLNSMAQIIEESKETLVNYDSLMKTAEDAAVRQITQLANSVAIEKRDVIVNFREVR